MNAISNQANTATVFAKTPTCVPWTGVRSIVRRYCFTAVILVFMRPALNGRPAENTATQATCVDLSKHYTAQLTNSINSPSQVTENNLATLPKGRQVFAEVPFEVGGLLQLSGKKIQE